MQKSKRSGLWKILSSINFEMYLSMFLSTLSALSMIASLTLISLTLSHFLFDEQVILLGIPIDMTTTITLLACMIVFSFSSRLGSFIVSHLGAFHLETILRTKLSEHYAKVPLGYIMTSGSGTLKKIMQTDVKELHAFVADSIPMIAKSVVAPITTLIILCIVDYRLALASLFVLLIGLSIMAFTMRDAKYQRELYEKSQAEISQAVIEFTQAMPVVRTFDDGTQSFKRYNTSLFNFQNNLNNWMSETAFSAKIGILILSPLPTLIAVLSVGVYLLEKDSLEFSSLILALFLSTGMADAFMPIMWLSNFLKKSQASAIRIQEVLDVETLKEPAQTRHPKECSITFSDVYFSYDSTKKNVLEKINFSVKEGSVTALVGPSGAGKSTIAKLIPRFWDIQQGSIKIGDVDIKDISSEILMEYVSFVFQDTFLFQDTLFNNIKMANPSSTKEDVYNAAQAAQIHDFIESLPNGYDTKAGDRGANLSGGQKQRITIARAILRNNPIIVLDEATAFADPQSEEKIIKALANLMKNKTVIVIAHRLSTIKDVDQIVVIDNGKVIEKGVHEELLSNKKTYYSLWQNYQVAQEWNLEVKSTQKEIG